MRPPLVSDPHHKRHAAPCDERVPAGMTDIPNRGASLPHRKRLGCAALGVILFAGWLGAGIALWHAAMNTPASPTPTAASDEAAEETSFSLFPRTDPDGEPTYEEEETSKP